MVVRDCSCAITNRASKVANGVTLYNVLLGIIHICNFAFMYEINEHLL